MAIKRIFTSISAGFEQLVNHLENHQAVADSAIAQAREGNAKLRAQLVMTEQKINQLQNNIQRAAALAAQWKTRALAETRDELALECLKAMQQQQGSVEFFQQQLNQQLNLRHQLTQYQQEVESRLSTMQLKRSELAARNTRATLINQSQPLVDECNSDSIFARWESSVIEQECFHHTDSANPTLDKHYSTLEETTQLTQMLHTLRKQHQETSL